ncbi:MAG: M48 family metallopeptidase [Chloroflexi bacterium]|nr:M48 family metallopeptidase [Chloroflexota bacterium]
MPIDPARQHQAKEYARLRHRLFALNLALTGIALAATLGLGLNVWLKQSIFAITRDAGLATLLYFTSAYLAYNLLFSPISFYSGFVLPHRYGLSLQNFRAWLTDEFKGLALALVLGGVVIEIIYALLRGNLPLPPLPFAPPLTGEGLGVGSGWWLYASAFMIFFSVVIANLAPVLIYPIFFKFKPLDDAELTRRLTALAERAHTRVRGVYTMMLSEKTTAANAALMGLGNTRRIVLGDTLYNNYTHDEIETILAHELGHHVHRDMGWFLVFQSLTTLAGFFIADQFLRASVAWLHYESIADLAAFPLLGIAFGVFGLLTMPIGNAFSRWRERMADDYALDATQNARAFTSAMEKLANQNLGELEPEPWVEFLLYDHPPLGKRIARGEEYARASPLPA